MSRLRQRCVWRRCWGCRRTFGSVCSRTGIFGTPREARKRRSPGLSLFVKQAEIARAALLRVVKKLTRSFAVKQVSNLVRNMGMAFEELEKRARALNVEEKAALARILIEELDSAIDPNAEQLWLDEAQRRYDAFLRGELEARRGAEVMQRTRDRFQTERE